MEQTIVNLAKAFAGESQARNRYTMYSKVAKKEGYEQIAEIFLVTADNEREHASWFFKLMNQLKQKAKDKGEGVSEYEQIRIDDVVPTVYDSTIENLKAAIAGENHEHSKLYPEFADLAEKEGLKEIATRIRFIAKAEMHHEERYKKLLEQLANGTYFRKSEDVWWVCRECGYVHFGKFPPEKCPSCDHAKAYYQLKCEEY